VILHRQPAIGILFARLSKLPQTRMRLPPERWLLYGHRNETKIGRCKQSVLTFHFKLNIIWLGRAQIACEIIVLF